MTLSEEEFGTSHFTEKRSHHNELEKKRRGFLKKNFQKLNKCLPPTKSGKDRVCRSQVLEEASKLIINKMKQKKTLMEEVKQLNERVKALKNKLKLHDPNSPLLSNLCQFVPPEVKQEIKSEPLDYEEFNESEFDDSVDYEDYCSSDYDEYLNIDNLKQESDEFTY
uniref:BHLH domain-containing protein n=1 Tax=Cuerna arida TaxID=1464854 RepID=A0A1B6FVC3_9HEMI